MGGVPMTTNSLIQSGACLVLSVLCSGVRAQTAGPATGPSQPPASAAEARVSFHLRRARLPDVLRALSEATGRNFAADSYTDDQRFPDIEVKNVPVTAAVENVARRFDR